MRVDRRHYKSEKQDWGTPQAFFDALHKHFNFTVDVCASPHNYKLDRYFDEATDGLARSWFMETVWCNPPYGRALPKWIDKITTQAPGCDNIVLLVFARTDTQWFHRAIQSGPKVCFLKKRLKFEDNNRVSGDGAFAPSCLFIWGEIKPETRDYLNEIGILMEVS